MKQTQNEIKKLSDQVLWDLTKSKVKEERELTLEIIDLVGEIVSRSLHLKRGYTSLHEYCVKELRYDDGTAHRRIKALNLVTQIPEVVQSIESGALSLTTASQIQNFFEQEARNKVPYTREKKIELLTSCELKSKNEIEKTLKTLAPETLKQTEKIKYVSATHLKLEIVIEEKLLKKIEHLKNLTSHKNRTLRDLIESLVDEELKRKDPTLRARASKPRQNPEPEPDPRSESGLRTENLGHKKEFPPRDFPEKLKHSRYIKAKTLNQVWTAATSQCTYIDPISGRRCEAKRFLQIEHQIPFALGGSSEVSNLTLLCGNHNKLRAIQVFGGEKMARFTKLSP